MSSPTVQLESCSQLARHYVRGRPGTLQHSSCGTMSSPRKRAGDASAGNSSSKRKAVEDPFAQEQDKGSKVVLYVLSIDACHIGAFGAKFVRAVCVRRGVGPSKRAPVKIVVAPGGRWRPRTLGWGRQ